MENKLLLLCYVQQVLFCPWPTSPSYLVTCVARLCVLWVYPGVNAVAQYLSIRLPCLKATVDKWSFIHLKAKIHGRIRTSMMSTIGAGGLCRNWRECAAYTSQHALRVDAPPCWNMDGLRQNLPIQPTSELTLALCSLLQWIYKHSFFYIYLSIYLYIYTQCIYTVYIRYIYGCMLWYTYMSSDVLFICVTRSADTMIRNKPAGNDIWETSAKKYALIYT